MANGLHRSPRVAAIAVSAVAVCMAVGLAWRSVDINLERACAVADTPYLPLCPADLPGSEQRLVRLRARIASNPGDSAAYVQLALFDRSAARPALQAAAARLSPVNPNVLLLQAIAALDAQDWPRAVGPLVHLAEHYANQPSALVLARLIAGGQGQLLAEHLRPSSRWLPQVLGQMPQVAGVFSAGLPLVAQAMQRGALDPGTLPAYIRQLKAAGAWADAYSLWLVLHGRALPVLYNGSFDQPFLPDGFDWELGAPLPSSRAGAITDQLAVDQRGLVLDIRFTGRTVSSPVLRQHLFLGEGRYRLRGDYKASQLRVEQGLVWRVRCTAPELPASQSAALGDTAGAWQAFTFEFVIPAGCGLVAALQLETYEPLNAATGITGKVAFDDFSLEKLSR